MKTYKLLASGIKIEESNGVILVINPDFKYVKLVYEDRTFKVSITGAKIVHSQYEEFRDEVKLVTNASEIAQDLFIVQTKTKWGLALLGNVENLCELCKFTGKECKACQDCIAHPLDKWTYYPAVRVTESK